MREDLPSLQKYYKILGNIPFKEELLSNLNLSSNKEELMLTRYKIVLESEFFKHIKGTKADKFMNFLVFTAVASPFIAFYSPPLALIVLIILCFAMLFFEKEYKNLLLIAIDKKIDESTFRDSTKGENG